MLIINVAKPVIGISRRCDNSITAYILHYIEPHYVTFLMHSAEDSTQESNYIIQEIIENIPSFVTNVNTIQHNAMNTTTTFITSKTKNALNILLYNSFGNNRACSSTNIINFIDIFLKTKLHKKAETLIIFFNDHYISENTIKAVFKYTWQHKILDFTIVTGVHTSTTVNSCIVWNYNPFYEVVNFEYFSPNVTIFPDKLNDVNGYKMKLGVISNDVYTKIVKDELNSNTTHLIGPYISVTEFILKSMNFSMNYIELAVNMSFPKGERVLLDKLQSNEINMFVIPAISYSYPTSEISRVAVENNCRKFVAWVPNVNVFKLHIPRSFIISLFVIPLLIIIITYIMQVYNIVEDSYTYINILQVLFSISLDRQPNNYADRFFFLSLIFVSLIYSNYYFSNLNVQLLQKQLPLDTFQDIDKSNFKLFAYKGDIDHLFWKSDPYIQKLKNKTQKTEDTNTCGMKLYRSTNNICIMSDAFMVAFKRSANITTNFRMSKPVLPTPHYAVRDYT